MGFVDYLIKNNTIICNLEVKTWEESIIKGGQILVDKGVTTPEYMETIVSKCKKNGPYIVIAPGIAMPHGRPEEGGLKLGYAIVTLKNPIKFNDLDNDPIRLLIFMAAPDIKSHNEKAVCEIADICDNERVVDKIINSKSPIEIIEILKEINNG